MGSTSGQRAWIRVRMCRWNLPARASLTQSVYVATSREQDVRTSHVPSDHFGWGCPSGELLEDTCSEGAVFVWQGVRVRHDRSQERRTRRDASPTKFNDRHLIRVCCGLRAGSTVHGGSALSRPPAAGDDAVRPRWALVMEHDRGDIRFRDSCSSDEQPVSKAPLARTRPTD